jgi:glycoprotein endo-alpha-1,2-mannosidase
VTGGSANRMGGWTPAQLDLVAASGHAYTPGFSPGALYAWGQGSYRDKLVPAVLAAAVQHGIKVYWHIEPYGGRTAASTVADIQYINSRYESSPVFYRDPDHGNRPAFYIFESLGDRRLERARPGQRHQHRAGPDHRRLEGRALRRHVHLRRDRRRHRHRLAQRRRVLPRPRIGLDDKEWTNAITPATGGNPDWVSVTSFNEWHEGSMIEPPTSTPPTVIPYLTYNAAYGTNGTASENAYLDRTRYWVSTFDTIGPVTPPEGKPGVAQDGDRQQDTGRFPRGQRDRRKHRTGRDV